MGHINQHDEKHVMMEIILIEIDVQPYVKLNDVQDLMRIIFLLLQRLMIDHAGIVEMDLKNL